MRKSLKVALALLLVLCMTPLGAFAALVDFDEDANSCGFYRIISKNDYKLAPGAVESEIIVNDESGANRNVIHVIEVDLKDPNISVMPTYKGIYEGIDLSDSSLWGSQPLSKQAAHVEENLGLNVVGGMNTNLRYSSNAPYGVLVWNGVVYSDERKSDGNSTAQTFLSITRDGEASLHSASEPIPEDAWTAISANFGWIIKDGVNKHKSVDHTNNAAPRSIIGIKEDGSLLLFQVDGRQSPYSKGMNLHECADMLISMGVVNAVNCDGGGSSTFISEREGTGELSVKNFPSDSTERATLGGLLVISKANADGKFDHATITSSKEYVTPGSTVVFNAVGADSAGGAAELPEDISWRLSDPSMGTIDNGVFVSGGKVGMVTAQLVYNGEVVGEDSVEVVIPTEFSFAQDVITVAFDKETDLNLRASVNNGLNELELKEGDVILTLSDPAIGSFNGFKLHSASEEDAPSQLSATIRAEFAYDPSVYAEATVKLGKPSVIIESFENGCEKWNSGTDDIIGSDTENVYSGNNSLKIELPGLYTIPAHEERVFGIYTSELISIRDAEAFGAWIYIPEELIDLAVRFNYRYTDKGEYRYGTREAISVGDVYYLEESGWHYISCDIKGHEVVELTPDTPFLEIIIPTASEHRVNGDYSLYLDDITVDYSEATEDRDPPVFSELTVTEQNIETAIAKDESYIASTNILTFAGFFAEDTGRINATGIDSASAKAYVDGVEVSFAYRNGRITLTDVSLADGVHKVRFEIADMAGNRAVITRSVTVDTGADNSSVYIQAADPSLDRLYGGSVYYLDIVAESIEDIKGVNTVIDINELNSFELAYSELAPGFEISYTVDADSNRASISVTRTGKNTQKGRAVLASLPIRIAYYGEDVVLDGYTAEAYWNDFDFRAHALNIDIDKGEIIYTDDHESEFVNSFSAAGISVDTEMYTSGDSIDPYFKAQRGNAHVHTPVALDDKAASCTDIGYSGRSYCEACASVVEWGRLDPMLDHSYVVSNGKLICSCGDFIDGNGLVEYKGKTYYLQVGNLVSGWVYETVDNKDTYYYFYPDTYTMATGASRVENMNYTFDENGVLIRGAFVKYSKGVRYFFAGRHLVSRWIDLEEGRYRADDNGYICYGPNPVILSAQQPAVWYMFDETTGLLEGSCNGFVEFEGSTYWCHPDGTITYGVVDAEGGKIFCATKGLVIKNGVCYVSTALDSMGGLEAGQYWCDENGYITRNGFMTVNSGTFYLTDYVKAKGFCKIGDHYYIFNSSNGKMYTDATMWVGTNSYGIAPGSYYFQADGTMYVPDLESGNKELRNENGKLYIYIDGYKQTNGLYELDGEYYYATSTGALAVNTTIWISQTNDLAAKGYYKFGSDGRVMQTGFLTAPTGYTYYLKDMSLVKGFTKIGDDYYLFNKGSGSMYRDVTMWLGADNGYGFAAGYYYFDAEGRLYIPDLENGEKKIITKDGKLYFTIDGFVQKYALFELDGEYYFATSTGPLAQNAVVWVAQTNGYVSKGYYKFEADGRMMKTGFYTVPSGYTYYIEDLVLRKGLTRIGDDYYFFNNGSGSMYKDTSLWIGGDNVYGLAAGYYTFQSDGKMYIPDPNGEKAVIYENGSYYFTIDGFKQRNSLFELNGDYYYASSSGALVTNSVIWVTQTNDLLPKAYYKFGSDGKIMKTGFITVPNGNTYYYNDLVLAKGLTKIGDYYYMFNRSSGMMYKDANMWISADNAYGFSAGSYYFDTEGRMVR